MDMNDVTEKAWNIAMRRKVLNTDTCAEEIEELVRSAYEQGRLDERMKNRGRIACEQRGGTGLAE